MSLRARLVLSLATMLAVALVAAGVLLVGLVHVSLVDRVDAELQTVDAGAGRLERLAGLSAADDEAGRRLAVMRLDRHGAVTRAIPSGFASDPDPLPVLPVYPASIPSEVFGRIEDRSSDDGSAHYRVVVQRVRGGQVAIAAPLTGVEDATAALVRTLIVVGLIAMAGLLAVGWVVVRRGLLPLEQIAHSAAEIAAGDLSHRAGVPHDETEVGRLGAAFDTMLDRIQAGFSEQQAALDAKARSEERLRRFAADASHELRTPLTVVRGYADLYRAGGLTDTATLEVAMDRIGSESRRMGALVDDLLLLARLDEGRPIRLGPVDLSRLVEDVIADERAVDAVRQVNGFVDAGIAVMGDEDQLRQLVGNLVANVRVHTPLSASAEIGLRRVDGAAELRVVDHGPGIKSAPGSSVFDRFYRTDPGRSRDSGGTGLGLAIAAGVTAAHGGEIWHQPTPGGGATFVVRLPFTASSQPISGSATDNGPNI